MPKRTETRNATRELKDAAAAYARVEGEALAITERQFTALNVDVAAATRLILVTAGRIGTYRVRIATELPAFDPRNIDGLVDYAKAAWYATVLNVPEPAPEEELQALVAEATSLRTHLLTRARPWVTLGRPSANIWIEYRNKQPVDRFTRPELGFRQMAEVGAIELGSRTRGFTMRSNSRTWSARAESGFPRRNHNAVEEVENVSFAHAAGLDYGFQRGFEYGGPERIRLA